MTLCQSSAPLSRMAQWFLLVTLMLTSVLLYTNQQGDLLLEAISNCNLIIASSCIAKGPGYTFFNGDRKTIVDYIFLSTSISHAIAECYTHDHHDLNFSDHLPLSVLLRVEYLSALQESSNLKVNWRKSVDDGLIPAYAQNVSCSVLPLLLHSFQSVSAKQWDYCCQ